MPAPRTSSNHPLDGLLTAKIIHHRVFNIPSYSKGLILKRMCWSDSIFLCQVLGGPTAVTLSVQAILLHVWWANSTHITYLSIVKVIIYIYIYIQLHTYIHTYVCRYTHSGSSVHLYGGESKFMCWCIHST